MISEGNSKKKILHSFFNKKVKAKIKIQSELYINDVQQYLSNIDETFLDINNYCTANMILCIVNVEEN